MMNGITQRRKSHFCPTNECLFFRLSSTFYGFSGEVVEGKITLWLKCSQPKSTAICGEGLHVQYSMLYLKGSQAKRLTLGIRNNGLPQFSELTAWDESFKIEERISDSMFTSCLSGATLELKMSTSLRWPDCVNTPHFRTQRWTEWLNVFFFAVYLKWAHWLSAASYINGNMLRSNHT